MIEIIHLQLLLATFAGWVGRQQSHVIAYLIEENRVLGEQLESGGGRLRFTDDQRRRLAAKGVPLGRKALGAIATIVTPDTILAWHRTAADIESYFVRIAYHKHSGSDWAVASLLDPHGRRHEDVLNDLAARLRHGNAQDLAHRKLICHFFCDMETAGVKYIFLREESAYRRSSN
jgi:hypothetical protein